MAAAGLLQLLADRDHHRRLCFGRAGAVAGHDLGCDRHRCQCSGAAQPNPPLGDPLWHHIDLAAPRAHRIVSEFVGGVKLAKASNTEPLYVEQLSGTLFAMRHGTLRFMRLFTIGTLPFQIGTAVGLAVFIWLAVGHFAVVYSSLITLVLLFMWIGPRVAARCMAASKMCSATCRR